MVEEAENILRGDERIRALEARISALEDRLVSLFAVERQTIANRCNIIVNVVIGYIRTLLELPLPLPPPLPIGPDLMGYNQAVAEKQVYRDHISHIHSTYARLTGALSNSDDPLRDARVWYKDLYEFLDGKGLSRALAQQREGFPLMVMVEEDSPSR